MAIRKLYPRNTMKALGLSFGVSKVAIHKIITGKTWGHLPLAGEEQ